jgi:hypothetical protein
MQADPIWADPMQAARAEPPWADPMQAARAEPPRADPGQSIPSIPPRRSSTPVRMVPAGSGSTWWFR